MSNSPLDDVSFDDITNNSPSCKEDKIKNVTRGSSEFHVEQVFYEKEKGKNVLRFAIINYGGYERYDLRAWYDEASKPGKGITFTFEEMKTIKESFEFLVLDDISLVERARYKSDKVQAIIYNQLCLLDSYSVKGVNWVKEIGLVDFGYGAKYDFRKWTEDYSICGKGIALTKEEMDSFVKTVNEIKIEL